MSPRRTLLVLLSAFAIVMSTWLGMASASSLGTWQKVGKGLNEAVYGLALSANDDTLYVVGRFAYATQRTDDSVSLNWVGQWRASDDTWLPMGKGLGGGSQSADAVAVSSDDTVYVGGSFAFARQRTDDTVTLNQIGRWRNIDDTWLPMGGGVNVLNCPVGCRVWALAVSANDGIVYAGGQFPEVRQRGGGTRQVNNIARWRASDDTWLGMGKGVTGGGNPRVYAITPAVSDDTVFVAGGFTEATQTTDDTIAARRIVQWRATDDTWLPLGGGVRSSNPSLSGIYVYDIAVVGANVYAVGNFDQACNDAACSTPVSAKGIAVWNAATGLWSAVGSSDPFNGLGGVAIVADGGGDLFVATNSSGPSNPPTLYQWDGSTWSPRIQPSPGGFDAMATDDTNFYGGGYFSQINAAATNMGNIARTTLGPSPSPGPGPNPGPGPAPEPVYPPGTPTDVKATAGSGEATITWTAPTYVGSYPVTDYQVTSSTGSHTCLSKTTSCTVSGLTGGTTYTFTTRALNGAGWGAYSAPSNAVTPATPVRPSILITGSRDASDDRYVTVKGTTTDLAGKRVVPWVRFPGQTEYLAGTGARTVSADGTFTWQRKSGKKVFVYFKHSDIRSNSVTIAAR